MRGGEEGFTVEYPSGHPRLRSPLICFQLLGSTICMRKMSAHDGLGSFPGFSMLMMAWAICMRKISAHLGF